MTTYVLRYAYDGNGRPSDPSRAHYLHKSVSVSRARGSRGRLIWKITPDVQDARRWATREGAEGYLASKFTYGHEFSRGTGVYSQFIVEEVPA